MKGLLDQNPDPNGPLGLIGDGYNYPPDVSRGLLSALSQTWPVRAAQSIWDAVQVPGDAYAGRLDTTSPDGFARVQGLAGLVSSGAVGNAYEPAALGVGFKGYHGSPQTDLRAVSAAPPARQFDNATSQFGAFFAPNEAGASRYAGNAGKVYSADFDLAKPYEMPWSEFNYLQSPHKSASGESLPGEMWGARAEELKQEALAQRQQLMEQGHDGVVVRKPNGDIAEIASFSDVPLK